jgi:hypothetical protein
MQSDHSFVWMLDTAAPHVLVLMLVQDVDDTSAVAMGSVADLSEVSEGHHPATLELGAMVVKWCYAC